VLLEVAWDNEPAIATYQRFGFEQLACRENYYGPGRHALILKFWDLPRWAAEVD
jgi:ribosomal-protein-alanine N-acetyltransferase